MKWKGVSSYPSGERFAPRAADNARPHDHERHVAALLGEQRLGDGLRVRVGVGSRTDDLARERVDELVVDPLDGLHESIGAHGRVVHLLANVRTIAVGVRGAHVNKCLW